MSLRPTEAELDILQVLWKLGPSSVKTVNEDLSLKRDVGYTTTLKILQIMNEKGLCTREAIGKIHIYYPMIKEEQVKNNFIQEMVDQVFEGSAMELVIQTLGNYKANSKEIKELKELIEQIEQKKK
ncbi:MAG: BlaI/MecI/CopY family transcriptional regulator [Bacteroidota bacterium]|nr:BlaI/MecI/CopY family transcriptional regulator [Bacteroidota bacterium]